MIKKHIGFTFLLLAGFIILAHSVIPHHHHFQSETDLASCEQSCNHHDDAPETNTFSLVDHQHNNPLCDGCHFNIDITNKFEKISINSHYCLCENYSQIIAPETLLEKTEYTEVLYKFLFSSHYSSRGPPTLC
jgi:hypothetical protein